MTLTGRQFYASWKNSIVCVAEKEEALVGENTLRMTMNRLNNSISGN
jgi:hypothetical protein